MRVADDGVGFDLAAITGGLGLVGMRERLHLLGGELLIDSYPEGGTRIEVRVHVLAQPHPATIETTRVPVLEHSR